MRPNPAIIKNSTVQEYRQVLTAVLYLPFGGPFVDQLEGLRDALESSLTQTRLIMIIMQS